MQNIKNFRKVEPTEKQRTLFKSDDGSIPVFLMSEDGMDWYESHKLFADDTIKIMYDSEGIIRSLVDAPVPQRGNIYAVSMFYPLDMSVVEISQADYPAGCAIDGSWKYDGSSVYQNTDIVSSRRYQTNLHQRNKLAANAATAIAVIYASADVGNSRDGDADNLTLAQQYLDALRDIDLTAESPDWPPVTFSII
ncbi:tail fiber assembly protein [Scandinavium goeteborgense]|uniref:tail fiber assembly protein n=1 Tax=Scandinavium goeteborgense TaxID=1851514 RepID=UPI002166A4B5|nr:tail fiber assembly protein [Scandinavium goeteborgense]MCS2154703.1 tail fiber assembly protein [Scandinavium goeteborgense]